MNSEARVLAATVSDARPKVISALAVHCRDLDLAEDAFAESAAKCFKLSEPPHNVGAWLITVGKRWIIDQVRRRESEARAIEDAEMIAQDSADVLQFPEAIADERLRLVFICCHPAIATEARAALALKVICGLPVSEIARVFLTSEATMFQRITRAKRKVAEAGIPFELPPRAAWGERLDAVLLSLELAYTVAYQDAGGERSQIDGADAGEEVARLGALVAELLPNEPEVLGCSALIGLAHSRRKARINEDGAMVPLSQQDTELWDFAAIEQARAWMDQAATIGKTGPYQIMAAIQLTHSGRGFGGETDWEAIVRLYNALVTLRPGPIAELNRAVALANTQGAKTAFRTLEALDHAKIKDTRPYYAARAELLSQIGRPQDASRAYHHALALDPPRAERLFLERKLAELAGV